MSRAWMVAGFLLMAGCAEEPGLAEPQVEVPKPDAPACEARVTITPRDLAMRPGVTLTLAGARGDACLPALNLEWSSSAPQVATVERQSDSTGTVRAVAAGRTTIRARRAGTGAVLDSLEIGVYPALEP
jgi:Bacterial Ig-like domain (group 2)